MKFIKRIAISLLLLFSFFFLITSIAYVSLLYKPENIIYLTNKLLNNDYSIQYLGADSDINLLNPKVTFDEITIKDSKEIELLKADQIVLGINLFRTLADGYIHLNSLEVQNYISSNSSSNNRGNFKLKIKKIILNSEKFNLVAKDSFFISKKGDISISNSHGKLNDVIFEELNIFSKLNSDKVFFSSLFYLDEKIIKDKNFIDLEGFSDYEIDLQVYSRGILETETGLLKSLNKYVFKDSKLITKSKYLFENINLVMHSNLDKSFIGLFSSSMPDQDIKGSILITDQEITVKSRLKLNMGDILVNQQYLRLDGSEEFDARLVINEGQASLYLESSLTNTKFISNIKELEKEREKELKSTIEIEDLSKPTYLIKNQKFKAYVGLNNNGYFSLGSYFDDQITTRNLNESFHVFLSLDKLEIDSLLFPYQTEGIYNLSSINLKIKEFNFFNNIYENQVFAINLSNTNSSAVFSSNNLNGGIKVDETGFIRVDLFDTKFEFKGIDILKSDESFDIKNFRLRFVGKDIKTYDDTFQNIDFYLLKNEKITTIDNIKITSKNFNIGPYNETDKAYISYNKDKDLYKIRGSYQINSKNNPMDNFINYNFDYISTELNIQWVSLDKLKDIEGSIEFLIKGLESKASLPDSTFLRALKVLNLNAIIENISNDSDISSNSMFINRAEGNFYISQSRALISNPIKLETSEANMRWTGEVLKNSEGLLNELNLDLDMRLRVSENIPWYAAIFGGIPALAGGLVIENIFEDSLDNVSTFKFKVTGSVDDPIIDRLD